MNIVEKVPGLRYDKQHLVKFYYTFPQSLSTKITLYKKVISCKGKNW